MQDTFDILIRNASIVDGTGAPRYPGDIGIRGDRIARIGDLSAQRGKLEIDLAGRIAAPGFIDAHTHDDRLMLSNPDMAPKVSQGITTVVAGNCGISLAPMPHVPQPVTPPLNLLDEDGKWFSFPTFASYIAALKAKPAATNCALLVGHTTLRVVTMDDLQAAGDTAADRAHARPGARSAGSRRHRRVHGPVLRARHRRADRGSHRRLPAAEGIRRRVLHPHAQRGRPGGRLAGGNLPHRPRGRRAGGDLAPQGGGRGQQGPFAGSDRPDREEHGHPADLRGLLSLHRRFHGAVGRSRRQLLAGDRQLVQALAAVRRARTWTRSRSNWA